MLNIFILEDEFLQQTRIETVIKDVIAKKSLKCKGPEIFGKPSQLLDAITERGSHQLFFLDIEIKGEEKKGLDIAKEIRKKDPNATIVFVTTHSEVERADDRLFRCHRSFIVNPENIVKINKEEKMVVFENNNECPISRTKYKGLLEKVKSLKS